MTEQAVANPLDQLPWSDDDSAPQPTEEPTRRRRRTKASEAIIEGEATDVTPAPVRALQTVETDHVIVGLGQLAKMSEEEFTEKLRVLQVGRERVATIQKTLMKEGTDYGKVKGIDRPFLHLPGAEVMEKFYGYVAEQRTVRLLGDGVTSPPFAYRTDTDVHLGDINGPIIASVSAVCNVWEERYRYRWEKPKCERCGHDLMRGGKDGKMAGKMFCPGFAGGCWWSTDIGNVPPAQKIENPDLWGLDETVIQISQKRSYVAAIRRATGTSGLFTIDEDSPSVKAQAEDAGDDTAASTQPVVETVAPTQEVARGGKVEQSSQVQINRLSQLSREKDLGPVNLGVYFQRVTGIPVVFGDVTDRAAQSVILLAAIQTATADQIGALIQTLETGEVSETAPAEVTA